jgi:hypothetical protein
MVDVRRVVVGYSPNGKSILLSDEQVPPDIVSPHSRGRHSSALGGRPGSRGLRRRLTSASIGLCAPARGFSFCAFHRWSGRNTLIGIHRCRGCDCGFRNAPSRLTSPFRAPKNGMHSTDTIDLEIVISGEVILELDNQAETLLHSGDTVIQNDTRHRWINRSDSPATLAVFIDGSSSKGG